MDRLFLFSLSSLSLFPLFNFGNFLKISLIDSSHNRESSLTLFALLGQLTLVFSHVAPTALFTPLITATSPMVPYIPPELLRAIVGSLSIPRDLARCCSTSKTFLSIAQPLLYDGITLDLVEKYALELERGWTNQIYLKTASLTLLDTLKSSPALRQLVQKITFLGATSSGIGGVGKKERKVHMKELIDEVMDTFPRTKLVHFDKLFDHGGLDEAVHSAQLRQVDSQHSTTIPAFSMVIHKGLATRLELRGAYKRFHWVPSSTGERQYKVEEFLQRSQHTLRNLGIPLNGSTSLALFQNLERLSLALSVQTPSNLHSHLSSVFFDLPSLRILLLHGSAREEDLGSLLTSGLLTR